MQPADEVRGLLRTIRHRLHGRDTALIAAGLTFYAGIAVVPALVLALGLTSWLTSPQTVTDLTGRLAEVLPGQLGAPDALDRLAEAGTWGVSTDHPRVVSASSGGTVRGGAVSGLGGFAAAQHLLGNR